MGPWRSECSTRLLSQAVMQGIYEVVARCHAEENSEEPCRTRAEVEAFIRHVPASDPRDYWIAESAGICVGFAHLAVVEGSTTGRLELLVHPDNRRFPRTSALAR